MKKVKISKVISIIIIIIMFGVIFKSAPVKVFSKEISPSEIVMEKSSKRVLYKSNESIKRPMASTTKIATCITVINNCNLEDEVLITKEMVDVEGSSIYLKEGEKLKVVDLLYGLMLRSGNDSACALAIHCSGSINKFAELMNKTAKSIGLDNTNFVNPHGLHDDNHYTTAYDLALLTCYALENETFSKIVSTKRYDCVNSDGYKRIFYNKNKLLSSYDGCDGVKTGYTKMAGRCLVSSATCNDMQLVTVVLGCSPMYERSTELFNNAFSAFSKEIIVYKNTEIGEIDLQSELLDKDIKLKFSTREDIILPLTAYEKDNLKFDCDIPEKVKIPIKDGAFLGNLNVYIGNNLICSKKLYIIDGKLSLNFAEAFIGVVNRWKFYEN